LKVLSDILVAVDRGKIAVESSGPFDLIDQSIMVERRHRLFGINSTVQWWFEYNYICPQPPNIWLSCQNLFSRISAVKYSTAEK
jgi:hypothetical protein